MWGIEHGLAGCFQALSTAAKQKCEDPLSKYNFGWSHGRESLAGGRPDVNKGSFYANPLRNSVTQDPSLVAAYPSYCRCACAASRRRVGATGRLCCMRRSSDRSGCPDPSSRSPTLPDSHQRLLLRPAHPAAAPEPGLRCPGGHRPNVWPTEELPQLEAAFQRLGRLITVVGGLLAAHCDRYCQLRGLKEAPRLQDTICQSPCPKVCPR